MSALPPRILQCRHVILQSVEHQQIQSWKYPDKPFYVAQMRQFILKDIPQLTRLAESALFAYVDPADSLDLVVGFGILRFDRSYSDIVDEVICPEHLYIPALSVNPEIKSKGYGTAIVKDLVQKATDVY